MRRYFDALVGGFLIALNLALGPFLHRWRTRWNATTDEVKEPLPGDEIINTPMWTYTHAIRILAPRAAVWPWLVQIGQGRGGFFSYDVLENLVGCDIHTVLELRNELQQLRAGDRVRMHANGFGPGGDSRPEGVLSFLAARPTATARKPHGASICTRLKMV